MKYTFILLLQLKVSEILIQTQAFFDKLTADSVHKNKIGYSIAKSKFSEGLKKLGVRYLRQPFLGVAFLLTNQI